MFSLKSSVYSFKIILSPNFNIFIGLVLNFLEGLGIVIMFYFTVKWKHVILPEINVF